jgi:dTDP-4-dehydrorhamnose reductase
MIWLIGNKGMLGTDVELLLKDKNYIASDNEIDITNINVLKNFIKDKNIDWIINCASYTAVDNAEDEIEQAFTINSMGVFNLSEIAYRNRIKLIHISTDYVFDGTVETKYHENSVPNPINIYGESKLDGEINIKRILTEFYIIRTAWLYGEYGNNFVKTILKLLKEKDSINVVSDQFGSPTYTKDLANVILKFIDIKPEYGIYHYTNEGKISWYEFAKEICKLANLTTQINPIPSNEYPQKAKRPKNSYMSKDKIKQYVEIKDWRESLEKFIKEIRNK